MNIIIAPQTFKGSISALNVAKAMESGVLKVIPNANITLVPVADGGDGTLETLVETSNGDIRTIEVTGPMGDRIEAQWGAMGDGKTAVIEMARTSGLALVPEQNMNPLISTTFGLGETIKHALDSGFRKFIIGIGGSATNDAGAGMAQALGIHFLDANGKELSFGGAALSKLDQIDLKSLDARALQSEFLVACDVSNPLTGPEGASAIYGPQKGASPEMVDQLDSALRNFGNIISRDIDIDVDKIPGSGAAGGLGAGLTALLGATLRKGVDIVLDSVNLDSHLKDADLVITGEGQMDYQTIYAKAPIGVAERSSLYGVPVIAISGSLGENYQVVHKHGISAVGAITTSPMTLSDASENASSLISSSVEQALRFMKTGASVF
tara:strand:- start:6278 stop:7420 length:1143 start_codon:yes stop_codon:yes gene_type:complete